MGPGPDQMPWKPEKAAVWGKRDLAGNTGHLHDLWQRNCRGKLPAESEEGTETREEGKNVVAPLDTAALGRQGTVGIQRARPEATTMFSI